MTERKQCENLSVRHGGRASRITKAHKQKAAEGEGIGSLSNNLVYTKRQKDIYGNRKHETTFVYQVTFVYNIVNLIKCIVCE